MVVMEGYLYDLYYLLWMEEVWVYLWILFIFDVINVKGNLEKIYKVIKVYVKLGKYFCI